MIQRLYVHNFKCLENFELITKGLHSALLIGKNGTGKTTIGRVLEILQAIGRGTNRVGSLVTPKDFTQKRSHVPIRFEIEALLENKLCKYVLALELPETFRELRVAEEQLLVDGHPIYSRKQAQVLLHAYDKIREVQFQVDWHLIALPVIQRQSEADPLNLFKTWLAQTIILAPIPALMNADSTTGTQEPKQDGSDFGEWLYGLLSRYPAAYTPTKEYLHRLMPDFKDVKNDVIGKDIRSLLITFQKGSDEMTHAFGDLSDGEKCFFVCAVLVAANDYYGPLFCFWDEPDNYLSLSEVGHLAMSLRRTFESTGQILVTSHHPEAIRKFSEENTFVLSRKSHLEPTRIRLVSEIPVSGDLVGALIRDDIDDDADGHEC
jgi:ABC-type multidrug transport system ATPase subunit